MSKHLVTQIAKEAVRRAVYVCRPQLLVSINKPRPAKCMIKGVLTNTRHMKSKRILLAFATCFYCSFSGLAQIGKPLYSDPTQPVERRVRDLMGRMTLEEKAQFLNHVGPDITRFNIKSDKWNQSLHGVVWNQQPAPQRTTFFPVSIAMGATWNPKLMHEVAAVHF